MQRYFVRNTIAVITVVTAHRVLLLDLQVAVAEIVRTHGYEGWIPCNHYPSCQTLQLSSHICTGTTKCTLASFPGHVGGHVNKARCTLASFPGHVGGLGTRLGVPMYNTQYSRWALHNEIGANTLKQLELTCSASLFSFAALRISVTSPTAKPVCSEIKNDVIALK